MYHCVKCRNMFETLYGRCASCGAWNSMKKGVPGDKVRESAGVALSLHEIADPEVHRIPTGTREFDRVLGGGLVQGSIVLLAGAPGSGKSTLAGQVCLALADALKDGCRVMYVTGEETVEQSKPRLARIYPRVEKLVQEKSDKFKLLAESDITKVLDAVDKFDPDILIIDSIQAMHMPAQNGNNADARSGTTSILLDVTKYLVNMTKARNTCTIVIGHINKDGEVGGPMAMEHYVDVVLTFGDENRSTELRILRALKNRFGATTEVGIFRMSEDGLSSVDNPSEHLYRSKKPVPGSALGCVMIRPGKGAGSRPMLIEVQALFGSSAKNPNRIITPQGTIERGRLSMLLSVLEAHTEMFSISREDEDGGDGGVMPSAPPQESIPVLPVSGMDLFVNIAGGFSIDEPDIDLPIALAIASARLGLPLPQNLVSWGEIDLLGNVRPSGGLEARLKVAETMGVDLAVCSAPDHKGKMQIITLDDALTPLYEAFEREAKRVQKAEKAKKKARASTVGAEGAT